MKTEWERAGEAWQRAYDTLEQRIEERAADLVKANEHLLAGDRGAQEDRK